MTESAPEEGATPGPEGRAWRRLPPWGQWVLAVGNPYGLEGTVSFGIVSAMGRNLEIPHLLNDFIQTDAMIDRGSSGGPLVDLEGRVVGINSTCLLESALLGTPTEALGDGLLRAHGHQTERLLAALVDKQVPVGSAEIDYWLERYAAPRPAPRLAS